MLSGGARCRLRFARLFSSPANVMLLDEPTNHLDIEGREALELALQGYQGTLIVISHDLYFMKQVSEKYFIIRNKTLSEIEDLDNLDELIGDSPSRENSNGKSTEWKEKEGLSKNQVARLEKIIRDTEEAIEKLETEKLELSRKMQQGTDDHRELAEMGIRFEKIEEEESSLMAEWEAAHGKLDNS